MSKATGDDGKLGRILGGSLVALLPVFFVDGFHDPFTASKLIPLIALGVPAGLLLSPRREGHDPLDRWRRAAMVLAPTWVLAAWVQGPADPYPLVLIASGWIFLSIGASFGRSASGTRRLVTLVAASAAPVLVVGVLRRYADVLTFIPDRDDVALAATIGNSNELAEFAAPVAVLALLLPATGRRWGWPLAAAAAILTALSESRGGMLGLALGGAVTVIALLRVGARPARSTAIVSGAALALGLVGAVAVSPGRVSSVVDLDHPTNVVRLGLWDASLGLWRDNPLLGCGAGRFEAAIPPYRHLAEWELSGFGSVAESPHNELLWLLATGGILGLATIVVAVLLVLRSCRDARRTAETSDSRVIIAACQGCLAAFAVTAFVRSPLHHPAGVMAPALATGVLAAWAGRGQPDRRPVPPAVWLTWIALLGAAWVGVKGLIDDARVYTARTSKVEANEALKIGQISRAVEHLTRMTEALKRLEASPPASVDRIYRAALVGSDVASMRATLLELEAQLQRQGLGSPTDWTPDVGNITSLLDAALERAPHHHLALLERARFHLRQGEIGQAHAALTDDAWRGAPWPARLSMLGRVAIRLGSDPDTFGFWLDEAPPAPRSTEHIDAAHEAYDLATTATDPTTAASQFERAREAAFRHLGLDPRDLGALKILTDLGTKITPPPASANRAVARSRLLLALEAIEDGNDRMVRIHLRIARGKDPTLLDAHYVAAQIAGRAQDADALEAAIQALVDNGLPRAAFADRAASDPAFDRVRDLVR